MLLYESHGVLDESEYFSISPVPKISNTPVSELRVYVTLVPDWAEKIKCGICSYDNNLIVTFGTKLKENFVENKFIELLKENNISYKIDGNMLEVGV